MWSPGVPNVLLQPYPQWTANVTNNAKAVREETTSGETRSPMNTHRSSKTNRPPPARGRYRATSLICRLAPCQIMREQTGSLWKTNKSQPSLETFTKMFQLDTSRQFGVLLLWLRILRTTKMLAISRSEAAIFRTLVVMWLTTRPR